MRSLALGVFCLIALLPLARAEAPQPPEQFLGYRVGADTKIADYETIQKYFQHLAGATDQVKYQPIGKTTAGREMFMAIVSSSENMKQLDRIREGLRRLSDPRVLDEAAARELARTGKTVLLVTCNIHSTEYVASQMVMELAYRLVTGKSEAAPALNDVVLLLVPSLNPDGLDLVVQWYDKYKGTVNETDALPWLYHTYAGHDNNRDFFMFNLAETRNIIEVAYRQWLPQIWIDEHQMGSNGPRLFVTPRSDPINPNVHPLQWRWQKMLGGMMALRLEERGLSGVIDSSMYDGWWEGGTSCGMWHNQICLLSEMASTNLGSPIFIDPSEIKAVPGITSYDIRANYPHPWRGGWWRPRDIVEYEQTLTEALLRTAAEYRQDLLMNYYTLARDAVERGKAGKPRTLMVPRRQNDPVTAAKMIEVLQKGGVEVRYSRQPIVSGNVTYAPENYLIDLAQPNGRYARDMFEEQKYPDLRDDRTEVPKKPYDVTGWTLPYLMGVEFASLEQAPPDGSELLSDARYPEGKVAPAASLQGKWLVAPAGPNANSVLINRLHKAGVTPYWTTRPMTAGGVECREGSVVFAADQTSAALAGRLASELHLELLAADSVEPGLPRALAKVRVGLYQPWYPCVDEGWTRLLLENTEFPIVTLHNADFKEKDLRKKIDVLIIPSSSVDSLKNGSVAPPRPAEYRGGLGKAGADNIKKFVEGGGGSVIALGEACNYAIDELGARARNTIKLATNEEFYCPGSLLRLEVDPTHPIGYGMPADAIAYQTSNLAFATTSPVGVYDRTVVARYPDGELLKSGYLLGEDLLSRRPAIVDLKQNKGHIVLLGLRVQNRHQTFGTFKLLFNAIHAAGMQGR